MHSYDAVLPAKTPLPVGLVVIAIVAAATFGFVTWFDYDNDRGIGLSMDEIFLHELKESAGCDPTTLVPFEQLEIRLTKTKDELLAMCERYVPNHKLRTKDLERK